MSERDLEAAFSQIILAFHCDQYTLNQRLLAEEHARNLAENIIQLELDRSRDTLEILKSLCLDSKRNMILQRLELCVDILGRTVERISSTSEVLGAVHQEARVSRTVELMVTHVENLRRRHNRNVAELEEVKKLIQHQESTRNRSDSTAPPDPEEGDASMKSSQQNTLRRRISTSIISSQTQEKRKQELKKQVSLGAFSKKKTFAACPSPSLSSDSNCSAMTKDDSHSVDDRPHNDPFESLSEATQNLWKSNTPKPECLVFKQKVPQKTQSKRCESWWRQSSLANCPYGPQLTLRYTYIFLLLCVVTLFYFWYPNM
ncbi:lymphoid-restricted membrane protein [Thalassophryne amazonica]|uniref:lymphoid-restricted membrane protein n=1 Tax=Thalassophryne amazonica TaxID=390379 RepID=UPI001471A2E5|nr:lymphoid-restricted membrane protein [Thalassophryne amazonica]